MPMERRRGRDPPRKMNQLGAPAGHDRRWRGRVNERRRGRAPLPEMHQRDALVREGQRWRGRVNGERRGKGPLGRYTSWVAD